jgi:hypothetical protein
MTADERATEEAGRIDASAYVVKRKDPLTTPVSGPFERGRRESNPQPPDRQSNRDELQNMDSQDVTPTPSAVCTRVCTSEAENANAGPLHAGQGDEGEGIDQGWAARGSSAAGALTDQADPLAKLAAALLALTSADRERLAAMLAGPSEVDRRRVLPPSMPLVERG